MASVKLLDELNLKELKQELKWRGLKYYERNNETLKERLRQALVDEEEDPNTYLFELEPDVVELLITFQKQMLAGFQNVINGDSQKETGEETREETETNSSTNAFATDVHDVSASISQIEQDNVVSYLKPVAEDIKDICQSVSADERNSNPDGYTQMLGKNFVCRALQGERQLQGTHGQGLHPTDVCPADETIVRSPDDGQVSELEPDAEDEGPSQVECCQLAPLVCPPDKPEEDVCHYFPSCGPDTHSQIPSLESPMKQPDRPTILVTPVLTSYPSPCAGWLPSVVSDRRRRWLLNPKWMAMQPRRLCNQVKVNWSRRRKRHTQYTTQMAPSRWHYKPIVAPTDRPPPASIHLHCPCRVIDFVRDGQI
ncbi:uncharacterized protein LOC106063792 [Biomphalaria glabrata]|uniref:Uncharacterized protein LOC106063792 n=1 Tax=Biomphalaria glabrata TaxID=6526 RepID=A0A9W2YDU1_BIOGL|nr:uncharacterized protein LOC106063792 [Biomphalaria glabrata]XP_055860852.1 uncharacterized protein LOC106063792 [Biomphalaria glabrata]